MLQSDSANKFHTSVSDWDRDRIQIRSKAYRPLALTTDRIEKEDSWWVRCQTDSIVDVEMQVSSTKKQC